MTDLGVLFYHRCLMGNETQQGNLPFDLRAEAAVLGAILLDNDSIGMIGSSLAVDYFYREAHRFIYRAMRELADSLDPIDTVTLSEKLREGGNLKQAGGAAYLIQLSSETPAAVNVAHYAKIVRDKALVRAIIQACRAIQQEGSLDPADVPAFIESAQARLYEVTSDATRTDIPSIREVIAEAFKHIESMMDRKERITGIPTGFVDLDDKLSGLQPSDLIILAARPAMGKTAFALNLLTNAAIKSGEPAVIFSLEMSGQQLATRMLCSQARVSASDLRTGNVNDADWSKLIMSVGDLSEAKIFVDDTPAMSIMELRAKCRRLHQERGLGLVVIDYLQLMRGSDLTARRSREQEISEISRNLKALAKELMVPVVALSQLNRGVESRTDKRPLMSDLRESGAIEQDADIVMFLYRDEYYNPESEKKGVAEVIIGKQRNGPTGTVELSFQGQYTLFSNLARQFQSDPPPPNSPF